MQKDKIDEDRQHPSQGLYIALFSIHGLIRGNAPELGRDADTGGQILYVLELARALARSPEVKRVDLFTRRIEAAGLSPQYAQPFEPLGHGANIVRVDVGPPGYIFKEQLWDHLDAMVDHIAERFRLQNYLPNILHSHYADAGYVGTQLAHRLGIPLMYTGHSLGRVKRRRLLASGLSTTEVETRYNISRRIEAETQVLATAERVITSTHQEITEQYEVYDYYQPEQMHVLPPGTDVKRFVPPQGNEFKTTCYQDIAHFLRVPEKPMILTLSRPDTRKNLVALVEAYGQSPYLQKTANLVIIAGIRSDINDLEENAQTVFHDLFVAIDRYDLYGKVALPKQHTRVQVPLYYRIAAATGGVFVNPALTEPFGLTLIEAAASGLPIVATEDGGPRDILANCQNGILIDPFETSSISKGIEKLLKEDFFYRQCSMRGIAGVHQHYSWNAHASEYLKLIKPIVARANLRVRNPLPLTRRTGIYRNRAIFSDLDQNLLGDPAALQRLIAKIKQHRKEIKFGIATGRSRDSALRQLRRHQIPEPDILIVSGGTEIYYAPKLNADLWWERHIDHAWASHRVKKALENMPGIKLQARKEQSRFKLSYYINPEVAPSLDEINRLLYQEELSVNTQLAFGQFLDITPLRASKGLALRHVAEHWQIPLQHIFVAGGSGADEDMMRGNTLAAVVTNRHHEELSQLEEIAHIYFAKQPYAGGILEALAHYHFFEQPTVESQVHQAHDTHK